uniref:Heat shock protein beta-11 n=1 Tax=Tetraselmis sp. GSL018 TaxID=582737 RepID=A0A061QVC3_9CHLO
MTDVAAEGAGGKIVLATCYDERFPPENATDGKSNTFWVTTGLYPQEIIVEFDRVTNVTRVTTTSVNVQKIIVEKSESKRPEKFEKAFEAELPNNGLKPQTDTQQVTFRAKFLRVIIASGYEHFAALSKVAAISGDGAAASEPVLDESRDSEESNEPEDSF